MNNLIILGKAPIYKTIAELKKDGSEIWALGTDKRKDADIYFELHGIKVNHPCVKYELPDAVYEFGLPINNSISALLIYAFLSGYKEVLLLGCPMNLKEEYIKQKPALAYCIGFLNAKGMNIKWNEIPDNTNYGRKKKT